MRQLEASLVVCMLYCHRSIRGLQADVVDTQSISTHPVIDLSGMWFLNETCPSCPCKSNVIVPSEPGVILDKWVTVFAQVDV